MEVNLFVIIAQYTKNKCLMGRSISPSASIVSENAWRLTMKFFYFYNKTCDGNFRIRHSVHLLRLQTLSTPTNTLFYILCILMLICSYTYWRNRHLHGSYASVAKTYSHQTVLQYNTIQYNIKRAVFICHTFS
jgi:hypothetical protein